MNLKIWKEKYIFFTGTPGIGKTVFRNYVIGVQIQKLKAEKGDGIFVLGKSPRKESPTFVMQMINGSIVADSIKVLMPDESVLRHVSRLNPTSSIRGYYHYDISKGYSDDALSTENSVCCYYTSPNEDAWKEKSKFSAVLIYLPGWSKDELERFFLSCGMNKTLLLKLGIQAEHISSYEDSMLWFPEACEPSVPISPSFLLRVKDTQSSVDHEYTISMSTFQNVIQAEIDEFGPIPRNMFLSQNGLKIYFNRINNAVLNLQATAHLGDAHADSASFRHRLVMFSRKDGLEPPFTYDAVEYTLKWISKSIMMKATTGLVKQFLANLNSNYLASINYIAPKIDRKIIERMLIFCLAAKPDTFKIELRSYITPVSRLPTSSDKLYTFPPILNLDTVSVRCLSNDDFEVFAVSGTDDTIAVPVNDYYPGVDAIAHITLKPAAGGKSLRMTAFINVTTSQEHEINPVALEILKNLCSKIRGYGPVESRREVGFFWVVQNKNFKPSTALKGLMSQFVVFQNPNEVTVAQIKSTYEYVEFIKKYADQHGMDYADANISEDRKIKYREFKKQQRKKTE
jgi:hypothetical protein